MKVSAAPSSRSSLLQSSTWLYILMFLTLANTTALRELRSSDDVANCSGEYLLHSNRALDTIRSTMRVMVLDTYIDACQNAASRGRRTKKGPVSTDAVFTPFLFAIHFLRTSVKVVSLDTLVSILHLTKTFPQRCLAALVFGSSPMCSEFMPSLSPVAAPCLNPSEPLLPCVEPP
jgi:hypothetical protein